jgi:O-antigen ligase
MGHNNGHLSPHNALIQIFLEFGLVGILTLAFLIILFISHLRKNLILNENYFLISAIVLLVSFSIYSLLDEIFYYGSQLFFWSIIIAYVLSATANENASNLIHKPN